MRIALGPTDTLGYVVTTRMHKARARLHHLGVCREDAAKGFCALLILVTNPPEHGLMDRPHDERGADLNKIKTIITIMLLSVFFNSKK